MKWLVEKWLVGEMAISSNDYMMKWQVDQMNSWWYDKLINGLGVVG